MHFSMKKSLLLFTALLLLSACDKNSFQEQTEEELQIVPVVLRESGTKTTVANKSAAKLSGATVVTVTVFQASAPSESAAAAKASVGSQLISLPVHTVSDHCTSNDLALVGGISVPAQEFYQLFSQPNLDAMPNYLRRTFDKERSAYITQLINNKVFEYAAAHEDFSNEAGYAEAVEDAVHKVNLEYFYDRYINNKVNVTDEEVKNYYEAHKSEYTKPAQFRAAHILVKVAPNAYRAEVSNAYARATDLRRRALEGEDFGQLASAFSDCPSKVKGGDLDFFTKGQTHPAFEKAVERLQIGDISPVVETSQGYHVIKLLDRIPERVRSFDEVKEELKNTLALQRTGELYENVLQSLTNKYKVIRNESLIRKLVKQY